MIDLTGQRFGKLTVIGQAAGRIDGGQIPWVCRCDCGETKIMAGSTLKKRGMPSCGRCPKRLDITGHIFGRLTAIEWAGKSGAKNVWRCRCSCGGETTVEIGTLRSGGAKSCGCLHREKSIARGKARAADLTGATFGYLHVIERHGSSAAQKAQWICECSCGHTSVAETGNLRNGAHQSCGCIKSAQEKTILWFVQQIDPMAVGNSDIANTGFKYDVVSASNKLVIEFNGGIWHSSKFKPAKQYHLIKRRAAEAAGYRMITIWQDEYAANPTRFHALIRDALAGTRNRIGARSTDVIALDHATANDWHAAHHVQQGRIVASQHIGLTHNGELVAVASFTGNTLARYTVKSDLAIVGGLPKLIKASGLKKIVTYCDRDHFTGKVYESAGFVKTGTTLQLTYLKGAHRVRRETYMRHKLPGLGILVADGQTEREALEAVGIYQCWNSGIDRWEWHA